uniref:Gag-pol polyprotein n=1 Tax=Rhabditophanes sp. KR3021 TaxID=114890 RepID=A0AC35U243_9BILA
MGNRSVVGDVPENDDIRAVVNEAIGRQFWTASMFLLMEQELGEFQMPELLVTLEAPITTPTRTPIGGAVMSTRPYPHPATLPYAPTMNESSPEPPVKEQLREEIWVIVQIEFILFAVDLCLKFLISQTMKLAKRSSLIC